MKTMQPKSRDYSAINNQSYSCRFQYLYLEKISVTGNMVAYLSPRQLGDSVVISKWKDFIFIVQLGPVCFLEGIYTQKSVIKVSSKITVL